MISPEMLRRYPFFGGLSEEQLKAIAMIADEETYETDEYIAEEGNECDALRIITEGRVTISMTINEDEVDLTEVPAGSIIGWSAVAPPHTLVASGVAATPVKIIAINAAKLRDLFDKDCQLGYVVLSQLVIVMRARLTQIRTQLASL